MRLNLHSLYVSILYIYEPLHSMAHGPLYINHIPRIGQSMMNYWHHRLHFDLNYSTDRVDQQPTAPRRLRLIKHLLYG